MFFRAKVGLPICVESFFHTRKILLNLESGCFNYNHLKVVDWVLLGLIMELSRGRCSCTGLILFVRVPEKDTILLRSGNTITCKELHDFGRGKFVSCIVFIQRDFFSTQSLCSGIASHMLIRLDWFRIWRDAQINLRKCKKILLVI